MNNNAWRKNEVQKVGMSDEAFASVQIYIKKIMGSRRTDITFAQIEAVCGIDKLSGEEWLAATYFLQRYELIRLHSIVHRQAAKIEKQKMASPCFPALLKKYPEYFICNQSEVAP